METIPLSGSHYFSGSHFSVEAICFIRSYFSRKCSDQSKLFLSVEAIIFSGNHWSVGTNHSIQWKLFLLMEGISFNGSYSFYWKPSILVKTIPFSGSHLRQWKPFLLGKAFISWESLPHFFFQWKLLLLIETFPLSRSHSFQCFNILVRRSQIHSVRSLKIRNLSCIHIPVEVFQDSEAYLGSC